MGERKDTLYALEVFDVYQEQIEKLSEKFPKNFHLIGNPDNPLNQFGILDIPLDTNRERLASSRFDYLYLLFTPNGPRALYTNKRSYLPGIDIGIRRENQSYLNGDRPFKPGYFVKDGIEMININPIVSNITLREEGQEDKSGIFFTSIDGDLAVEILENAYEIVQQADLDTSYAILNKLDSLSKK